MIALISDLFILIKVFNGFLNVINVCRLTVSALLPMLKMKLCSDCSSQAKSSILFVSFLNPLVADVLALLLAVFLKPGPFLIVQAGKEWLVHRLPFTSVGNV